MRFGHSCACPEVQEEGASVHKLTEIDLSELQLGEKLTIYRGSSAFLTGPGAAGYVGDATVLEVRKKSAILSLAVRHYATANQTYFKVRTYRLRFKDARICRIPNGEVTELYVHARGGRPTVTAYFTDGEYALVKRLLGEAINDHVLASRGRRWAANALERMAFHDGLRANGGRDAG